MGGEHLQGISGWAMGLQVASSVDDFYSTWLSQELAHLGEGGGVFSDAPCRPQTLPLLGGMVLLCCGPAWMPSDTQLNPGESEARRHQQVLAEKENITFESCTFLPFPVLRRKGGKDLVFLRLSP